MATRDLILASVTRQPMHGYVLKKRFGEFINPSEKLNDAKLYPMLKQMEDEGLITRETEVPDAGPSRKVIRATEKGRRAYRRWLEGDSSEGLGPRPRYDFFRSFPFLTKYSYFYDLDDATALEKLERQAESHRARLDDYRAAREKMIEKGLETCKIQAIDFGMRLEETILEWLADTAGSYRRGKTKKAGAAGR
ncbi:MAG: PadR family transcriptional regulator [Actinobacteria bacterium]|nr:PadR family transcriptional regulator [Actinomycetota bacterium]MBU1942046.1 PadR family transcriptional regulator [Actinomycetota bacterium]MBU2687183.1 PadR family transcriptional regulator [Actinomycetota bacterium]